MHVKPWGHLKNMTLGEKPCTFTHIVMSPFFFFFHVLQQAKFIHDGKKKIEKITCFCSRDWKTSERILLGEGHVLYLDRVCVLRRHMRIVRTHVLV